MNISFLKQCIYHNLNSFKKKVVFGIVSMDKNKSLYQGNAYDFEPNPALYLQLRRPETEAL